MKTYDIQELASKDATSLTWGLAWCRLLAKETPSDGVFPVFSLEDEEWNALLGATSVSSRDTIYFLPWEAVALKLLTDPSYALSVTEEGYSQAFRSPEEIANHLRGVVASTLAGLYPPEMSSSMGSMVLVPRF